MWAKILKGFSNFNPTLAFYKFIAVVLAIIVGVTVAYREGKRDCQQSALETEVETLTETVRTERETVIRELRTRESNILNRLSETQTDTIEYNNTIKQLRAIQGDLYEAIRARTGNAACAPSVQELRALDGLAERTKPRP